MTIATSFRVLPFIAEVYATTRLPFQAASTAQLQGQQRQLAAGRHVVFRGPIQAATAHTCSGPFWPTCTGHAVLVVDL